MKRIAYIDNLRWICVWLVVLFHVTDIFTCTGVPIHYNAPGIPAMDLIGYFVYPWFMALLFILAGMSARESLKRRTAKEFAKERTKRLLLPFIAYTLIFSIPTAAFSFQIGGGWNDFAAVPKPMLLLIMYLIGLGHTWFLLELYAISLVFLTFKKLEKHQKFMEKCENINIWVIILFVIPLYFAAQVLNVVEVFRNLFYLLLFLLGYFVFSNESVQNKLVKYRIPLLAAALVLFVPQAYLSFGKGFAVSAKTPAAILYGYVMCLAMIGNGKVWLSFENGFTRYMSRRSFSVYLFHYLPMLLIAYFTVNVIKPPVWLSYVIVFVLSAAASVLISEIIYRIKTAVKKRT